MRPVRLRLSRARGFDLQAVSRANNGLPATVVARPTKWGNPFVIHHPNGPASLQRPMSRDLAVSSFRSMVERNGGWFPVPLPWPKGKIPTQFTTIDDVARELRGHNLACWCPLCPDHAGGRPLGVSCDACAPCHGDVLLEIAREQGTTPEVGRG